MGWENVPYLHLLLKIGFKVRTSGVGSNHYANYLYLKLLSTYEDNLRLKPAKGTNRMANPENTHHWGKHHCTAGLQFNKTGTDQ